MADKAQALDLDGIRSKIAAAKSAVTLEDTPPPPPADELEQYNAFFTGVQEEQVIREPTFAGEGEIRAPRKEDFGVAGRTAGGIGGGVVGGLTGGIPGAVFGAAEGGILGAAYDDAQLFRGGEGPSTRDLLDAGATEGLYELAGQGMASFVAKGINRVLHNPIMGAKAASSVIKDLGKAHEAILIEKGFSREAVDYITTNGLTPAQASRSKFIDKMESVADGTSFGSGLLREVREAQEELYRLIPDTMVDSARVLGKDETARVVIEGLENIKSVAKGRVGAVYQDIAQTMGTYKVPDGRGGTVTLVKATRNQKGLVDTSGWRAAVQDTIDSFRELGGLDVESQRALLGFVDNLPPKASFESVKNARTRILDKLDAIAENPNMQMATRDATRIEKAMKRSMRQATRDFDTEMAKQTSVGKRTAKLGSIMEKDIPAPRERAVKVSRLLRFADEGMLDISSRIDREIYRGFVKMAEETDAGPAVFAKILSDGNPTVVKRLFAAIGPNSKEAEYVRSSAMAALWERSLKASTATSKGRSVPQGRLILDALEFESKGMGKDMASALFRPTDIARAKKVANALFSAQVQQHAGGGLIGSIVEAGAFGAGIVVLSNPSWDNTKQAGATIGGTAISLHTLGKIMASPRLSKYILDGAQGRWKGRAGIALFGRLLGGLPKDGYLNFPSTQPLVSGAEEKVKGYLGSVSREGLKEWNRLLGEMATKTKAEIEGDGPPQTQAGNLILDAARAN